MTVPLDPHARDKAMSHVVFLSLPEAVRARLGDLFSDPELSIPLETAGVSVRGGIDSRSLTEEALLSGMLRVLAWEPEHKGAAEYRRIVRSLRPELLSQLSEAGVSKAGERQWEIAEEIFRALAGLYPEQPEPFLDLAVLWGDRAESLAQTGQESEAEAFREKAFGLYRELLSAEPAFPPAFYNAATFHLRARNYGRAHELLTSFVKLSDDEERIAKAREILEGIEASGALDELFREAYDFIRMGKEEEGLEKALRFTAVHPEVWNGWFLAGWASRRLGRWEEGVEYFTKALARNPGAEESADSLNECAICQMELGRYGEARTSLEKALRLEGENIKVITNLGVVALKAGKRREAAGFFRAALDLESEDPVAERWLRIAEGDGEEG